MKDLLAELSELLARQSIRYGKFKLASGAESHYFCDTKLTLLSPRGSQLCGEALCRVLECCDVETVGGLAMGAAYIAAAVAQASSRRSKPLYGYTVRNEVKDHGRCQRIDESWHPRGDLMTAGRRVAVVDDVLTSGGSTIKAIEAVQEAGCDIRVVVAILDRNAGGAEKIEALGFPFFSLFVADEEGRLSLGRLPDGLL